MNFAFIVLLLGLSSYLIFSFGYFFVHLLRGIKISKLTRPFERHAHLPIIGIFGDSTALGVGASTPEKSLAGLLGRSYPESTVINKATNGFSIEQTTRVLERQNCFDLLIICCGGVDILCLKNNQQIQKNIQELFTTASNKSKHTIIVTPLNLGLSTVFPWFLKKFFLKRSKKVGLFFEKEAESFPNIFVSNNLEIDSVCFIPPWKKISAPDRIHPNDDGYRWVFKRIEKVIENQFLAKKL